MKHAVIIGTIVTALLAVAPASHAQELGPSPPPPAAGPGPGGFGGVGQVAIQSDFALSFYHRGDFSYLLLAPAIDYFIAPGLSVGGFVELSYSKTKGSEADSTFGIGPRVSYVIPLGDAFSIYPRGGLEIRHSSFGGPSYTLTSLAFAAPFLFHPVPHFFIGLGPTLVLDLFGGSSSQRDVSIGLSSTVGGWFDW